MQKSMWGRGKGSTGYMQRRSTGTRNHLLTTTKCTIIPWLGSQDGRLVVQGRAKRACQDCRATLPYARAACKGRLSSLLRATAARAPQLNLTFLTQSPYRHELQLPSAHSPSQKPAAPPLQWR